MFFDQTWKPDDVVKMKQTTIRINNMKKTQNILFNFVCAVVILTAVPV